jgi:hypothetical protein
MPLRRRALDERRHARSPAQNATSSVAVTSGANRSTGILQTYIGCDFTARVVFTFTHGGCSMLWMEGTIELVSNEADWVLKLSV